ncbi:TonB-linked SusC/RagA family outer membrane protein [Mucilaginibacter yixingensis]|uniref:TonB-linked SusC/RagA family outer membrane protein n=1 Tax=Mucilaginibacter yixingensis TaxID=1295612 RepID=A0A2T5JDD6_9SPHI|nr:SusC/RagA family TonB-linked outer membrane protein [Mucilaginibacter yixingensis]PTQ99780.1 TonB-linked SusC/RagA family outer membrane protein [Mucilaginibacter yixingensis]
MKKLLLASLCFLMLCAQQLYAQNRTVSGVVTAKEDGAPLPGVSVKVRGANIGTQTGIDGHYTLSVPASATFLEFSFIGYSDFSMPIAGRVVNATLTIASKQLGEVVVTALGIKREARSLGYSTSTVRGEDVTKARDGNVLDALAGQMAGVRVNNTSGTIGGSSKIVIRGVNSLSANNTLYVIDGSPVNESTSAGGTIVSNVDYGNRMGDLAPDDIESITVLKGAAAAALYGNRAKDGAVIITTKKGKKGTMSVDINSSIGFSNPLVLPKFQNEWAQGNFGTYALTSLNGWGPNIANSNAQNLKFTNFLGQNVALQAYPDNVKDFFQTGVRSIDNIAISGADENGDYRISFSNDNEKGFIPQSTLAKYTLSINAGRNFSKSLTSRFTGSYTSIAADGRPAQASNNTNGIVNAVYGMPRTVDIHLLGDNYQDPVTGNQITLSPNRNGNNPFWIMNYNRNSNTVDHFIGTYNLTYKPIEWFSLSNNFGADVYTEKRAEHIRNGTVGYQSQFSTYDLLNQQINDDLIATIEQNILIKDFKFKLVAGGNINQRFAQATNILAVGLTVDQLYTYSNAASKTPTQAYSKQRSESLYGDLTINYKDYLYLDITGRNDFTSTLPINSRSFFYPSFSGSFNFSELLKSNSSFDWLSSGKLRASWASVGSDLGPYLLDYAYTPTSTVFLQYVSSTATVFPAGPISTAFTAPTTLPNANLVPQKVNTYEFGTDLSFLHDRIGLVFNYYTGKTRNNLLSIATPPSSGYSFKVVNAGVVQNIGYEAEVNTTPIVAGGFKWDLGFNFNKNKQKVLDLAPGLTQLTIASGYSGLFIKAEPGQGFGLYGSAWKRSPDGQFIIDPASGLKVAPLTNQRLGNIYADWTGGIKNTFSYKGLSLFTLVDIRKGGVFFSGTVANLRSSGLAAETGGDRTPFVDPGVNLVNGAYVPNTTKVSSVQAYWVNQASVSNTEGDVFDAGFIKLRQVSLSYAIPKSVLGKSFIKKLQIGAEGTNLWLIKSHVPHVDPESNFFGAGSAGEGVEFNSIPTARVIGINLRATL